MINEHTRFWTAALSFFMNTSHFKSAHRMHFSYRSAPPVRPSRHVNRPEHTHAHKHTQIAFNLTFQPKKRNQRIEIRPYRLGHFARHLYFLRAYDEFFVCGCVLLFGCLYFSFSNCIRYDKHTLSRMMPSLRSAVSVRGIGIHIPKQHKKTTGTSRAPERQRLYFACLST